MTSQPNDASREMGDTRTQETNEPNEFGFAGGATTPQPATQARPPEEVDAERIAVPAGDLTGAITHAIEEIGQRPAHGDDGDGDDGDEEDGDEEDRR